MGEIIYIGTKICEGIKESTSIFFKQSVYFVARAWASSLLSACGVAESTGAGRGESAEEQHPS